jgi:hypothetical protein
MRTRSITTTTSGSLALLEDDVRMPAAGELDEAELNAQAGFGALKTRRGCLPLRAMDIKGRIHGLLAQVTIRQTFVNVTDESLEASYTVPLPDPAAVASYKLGGASVRTSLSLHADAAAGAIESSGAPGEGTFALTIVPLAGSGAAGLSRPRDVVFVLDCSGSTEGWKAGSWWQPAVRWRA